jgi:hypothetical protein
MLCVGPARGVLAEAPNPVPSPTPHPLGYFLPKHVLTLEITTTTETRREPRQAPEPSSEPCDQDLAPRYPVSVPPAKGALPPEARLCIDQLTMTTREVIAQLRLVPDLQAGPYTLGDPTNLFTDQKVSLELREGAILKSLNATSQGRFGEVVSAVVKLGATLVGLAPLATTVGAQVRMPPKAEPPPTSCNPFVAPYRDLEGNVRLLLSRNDQGCRIYQAIEKETQRLGVLSQAAAESELRLGGTDGKEAMDVLIARLNHQRKAIDNARKVITALQETFNAELAEFVKKNRLGTQRTQTAGSDVAEIYDLPPPELLSNAKTPSDVLEALMRRPVARAIFDRYGVVATAEVLPGGTPPKSEASTQRSCTAKPDYNQVEVYYRNGQPVRLEFFIVRPKKDPADPAKYERGNTGVVEEVVSVANRIQTVMLPGSTPGCVAFKASAFAKRELIVQFDESGQLVKVDQIRDSSAAAVAAALAAASTTFRDEYALTLSKVVEVQEARRTIELGDLRTKVEALEKQRELIDAQLAADSAAANFDLTLRRQQLAAELAQLEAEVALQTAQATADQRLALEQLKAEVGVLRQELDLLKARQELEQAQK